ncbi:MAG: SGNH/GDSL hydrolase family protein, partial [Candidatus Brocadiia bacterium]
ALFIILPLLIFSGHLACNSACITRILPVGSGPAGPVVSAEPFNASWYEGKVVLVGIGDSITNGFGASEEHGYFSLLAHNDDKFYPEMKGRDLNNVLPKLRSANYSQDYTISQQHIDYQVSAIPKMSDDIFGIIVITSGGNDLIHDYGRSPAADGAMYGCTYEQALVWTENLKQRQIQILEGVMAKFPGGCEIFFANIYDPTDGVGDPAKAGLPQWPDCMKVIAMANRNISDLSDRYDNVHLVDIHSAFLGHGIHCKDFWRDNYQKDDPNFWYYLNLEDPNPRGYDAIRRLFLLKMAEVLPWRLKLLNGNLSMSEDVLH